MVERSATGTSHAAPSRRAAEGRQRDVAALLAEAAGQRRDAIQTSAPIENSAPMPLGERPFSLRRSDPSRFPMPPTKPSSTVASIA